MNAQDSIINSQTKNDWAIYIDKLHKLACLCMDLIVRKREEAKAFASGDDQLIEQEIMKTQTVIAEHSVIKVEAMLLSTKLCVDKIDFSLN